MKFMLIYVVCIATINYILVMKCTHQNDSFYELLNYTVYIFPRNVIVALRDFSV